MHYVSVERKVYKLTNGQMEKLDKKRGVETENPDSLHIESLDWIVENGEFVFELTAQFNW